MKGQRVIPFTIDSINLTNCRDVIHTHTCARARPLQNRAMAIINYKLWHLCGFSTRLANISSIGLTFSFCILSRTASASFRTRNKFAPANLVSSSIVQPTPISSANSVGYLDTSSKPCGVLCGEWGCGKSEHEREQLRASFDRRDDWVEWVLCKLCISCRQTGTIHASTADNALCTFLLGCRRAACAARHTIKLYATCDIDCIAS